MLKYNLPLIFTIPTISLEDAKPYLTFSAIFRTLSTIQTHNLHQNTTGGTKQNKMAAASTDASHALVPPTAADIEDNDVDEEDDDDETVVGTCLHCNSPPPPRSARGGGACTFTGGSSPCPASNPSAVVTSVPSHSDGETRVQVSCDDCRSFICDGAYSFGTNYLYGPRLVSLTVYSCLPTHPSSSFRMSLVPRVSGKPRN